MYISRTVVVMAQIAKTCTSDGSLNSIKQIQDILNIIKQSKGLRKHLDMFMKMLSVEGADLNCLR